LPERAVTDLAVGLNARIGKSSPRPSLPTPATAARADRDAGRDALRARLARLPAPVVLLSALVIALWPHWVWMARRLTDGSDEPWGVLALVTVLVLIGREWRALVTPSRAAMVASAALALAAMLARWWLPPLAAAAIAMLALATLLGAARHDRRTAPLASLLLLALPVIASLQFYFGYPLRLVTAALAAPVLQRLGFAVEASGAAFAHAGKLVLVDPPCAGIGMLWVGAYTAALLSHLNHASTARTFVNGVVAAGCVFVANVARNVELFFQEALDLGWPAWTHAFIGLAAFGIALLPIVLFVRPRVRPIRSTRRARFEWPQRYHRRIA
jgi:exosortase/archaeosortase family protein